MYNAVVHPCRLFNKIISLVSMSIFLLLQIAGIIMNWRNDVIMALTFFASDIKSLQETIPVPQEACRSIVNQWSPIVCI